MSHWKTRYRRLLGAPIVERELLGWKRWLLVASVLTGLAVAGNVAYYMYLAALRARPEHYWVSSSDIRYLEGGFSSVAAFTDMTLLPVVMLALLVLAPGLACLTVMREAQSRTLDSLIASPMGPAALHNGFVLGSLARLAPWVAPALLLHVVFGLTGMISPVTMIASTSVILIGAWGLTSLGAMIGALVKGRAQSGLTSLAVFGGLGFMVGVPIFALETYRDERIFAALSPAASALHSLFTDPNTILALEFSRLEPLYDGRILSLPLSPVLMCIALMLGIGALSTHASIRRFADPLSPPFTRAAAAWAVAGFSALAMFVVALKIPDSTYNWYDRSSFGEHLVGHAFILNCVVLPMVVLMAAGTAASAQFTARAAIRGNGDPESFLRGDFRTLRFFGLLMLIPLGFSVLMPILTDNLPMPLSHAEIGVRPLAVFPWAWGLLGMALTVAAVQHTAGKVWQQALGAVAVVGFGACSLVLSFIIIEGNRIELYDFTYADDGFHFLVSLSILGLFLAAPFALAWFSHWRRGIALERLSSTLAFVRAPAELPDEPFAWPAADELSRWTAPLLTAAGEGERWIAVEAGKLRSWRGAPTGGHDETEIDLASPFSVTATVQPDGPEPESGAWRWLMNVTVASGARRVMFAVPVLPTQAVDALPRHDQRLATLGSQDSAMILGALRFHAEAGGIPLPI